MYLPRDLISHLYTSLRNKHSAHSTPVNILVALEPDALCASRILVALLKRDYIQHQIHVVSGYSELERLGRKTVQPLRFQNGGNGGTVICLGVGGMIDLAAVLGLEASEEAEDEDPFGGVEVWLVDARRPWHLNNVFGGRPQEIERVDEHAPPRKAEEVVNGRIQHNYRPGKGGIIVYDDGDVDEELVQEKEAFFGLEQMPDVDDDGEDLGDTSDKECDSLRRADQRRQSKKRKSWSDSDEEEDEQQSQHELARPRRRRKSNSHDSFSSQPETLDHGNILADSHSSLSIPSTPPPPYSENPFDEESTERLRRRILRLKRKHNAVIDTYFSLGTSYSEPISAMLYSLASSLGREENDFLWYAVVGVSSLELYGHTMTGVSISTALQSDKQSNGITPPWQVADKIERIKSVLRDEVKRLNPPNEHDIRLENQRGSGSATDWIPTTARSPTDSSIRLSPEPRFLLVRHWSLYESMLHSPYLATRLHLWSDIGKKRLHKFLAKMGVSLGESRQTYTHMAMDLKRDLRQKLLRCAPLYGLDGLVPGTGRSKEGWGFVRSWGWNACLSDVDTAIIIGAILEVGKSITGIHSDTSRHPQQTSYSKTNGYSNRSYDHQTNGHAPTVLHDEDGALESEAFRARFWAAYDALADIEQLKAALPIAQHLHRAILRAGSSILGKKQIKHLRVFRLGVLKDGPDVAIFGHPSAALKLALWVGEAVAVQEGEKYNDQGGRKGGLPLVLACLNESRGVYLVVGTGGGGTGGRIDKRSKEKAESRKKKQEERAQRTADKVKQRQEKREERRRIRELNGDDEEDDEEDEDEQSEESEDSGSDEEEEDSEEIERLRKRGAGRNRFGIAFQEVVDETNARVKIDSFENCVVEVKKEDLSRFLEALAQKRVTA
ncbi:hypothetical protein MMC25_004276 [Agyrium rufum]|nr:hypothetical protein [Agyrium rufum]